ncbi:La-related protein 6 [Hordeum vulgare]|nr:La-related protein 6 [Hordeum vulgare]
MSQVKWFIPNPSGSTTVDLFEGPAVDLFEGRAADLLGHPVKDLRSLYAIEPILSFLKDTLCGGSLGSSISKLDLIDHDHKESTHKGSSKVKRRTRDIRERTMGICSSNWKDPSMKRQQRDWPAFFPEVHMSLTKIHASTLLAYGSMTYS